MMDIIDFLLFLHKTDVDTSYVEVYDFGKYSTNQIFQSVKMLQLKNANHTEKLMMRDNLLAK